MVLGQIHTVGVPRSRTPQELRITSISPVLLCVILSLLVPSDAQCRSTSPITIPTTTVSVGKPSVDGTTKTSSLCPLNPKRKGLATKGKSGLHCLDGALGQWFPILASRRLLEDVKRGAEALKREQILTRRVEVGERRVVLLALDVATTAKIATAWRKVAVTQSKQLLSRQSIWRSPVLWFAIGVVLTSATVTSVAVAVK